MTPLPPRWERLGEGSSSLAEALCDGILEAGWLGALIIAPLLFNVYTERIFDTTLSVRSIALLMAAAGLAKLAIQGAAGHRPLRHAWVALRRRSLGLPVLLLVVAYAVSTVLSLSPTVSWWGSYTRSQGAFTIACYLVIFAGVSAGLRRQEQVQRLTGAIAITATLVSLYAVLQRLHLDPIVWSSDTSGRATGTLGNPDFMAGYLIMALPVTIWTAFQHRWSRTDPWPAARSAFLTVAALVQLIAVLLSVGRGAMLGLAAALLISSAVAAAAGGRRRLAWAILTCSALAALSLGVLNTDIPALATLRGAPFLSHFTHALDSSDGSSQVRLLLWKGAAQVVAPHAPLQDASGRADMFNPVRPLVGYGADSAGFAYNRFVSPEFLHFERPFKTWDRAHNQVFDTLISTGAVGLAAYLLLFLALFVSGLSELGLRISWRRAAASSLGGAALGGVAGIASGGVFAGLTTAAGFIAGLCVSLLMAKRVPRPGGQRLLALAILTGIMAHFVETQFEFDITATSVYLWTFAGLLLALPRINTRKAGIATAPAPGVTAIPAAFVSTLILIVLGFDFIAYPGTIYTLPHALAISLLTLYGTTRTLSYGVLGLLLVGWLAATLLWSKDSRDATILVIAPPLAWFGFAFLDLWWLRRPLLGSTLSLLQRGIERSTIMLVLDGCLLLLVLCLSVALTLTQPSSRLSVAGLALLGLLVVGAGWAAFATNSREGLADALQRTTAGFGFTPATARPAYEQAATLWPFDPARQVQLGEIALRAADPYGETPHPEFLDQARQALDKARQRQPFDPLATLLLARLDAARAHVAFDSGQAQSWQRAADTEFARMVRLDPKRPSNWSEWALFSAQNTQDYAASLTELAQAFALDPEFEETFDAFDQLTHAGLSGADAQRLRDAIASYAALPGGDKLANQLTVATAYTALRDWPAAIENYQRCLPLAPIGTSTWAIHRALSKAYLAEGDRVDAVAQARQAVRLARPAELAADGSLQALAS